MVLKKKIKYMYKEKVGSRETDKGSNEERKKIYTIKDTEEKTK